MPFITQKRRKLLARDGLNPIKFEPGDLCYIAYKRMVDEWKKNPRWTTIHRIYMTQVNLTWSDKDHAAATSLAWQVFFHLYAMPYELQKKQLNGDI